MDAEIDPAPRLQPPTPVPVVGIGASAGGLAAFEAFFSGMPADADPGMAFVLVQHLAPDHKSILSDLIRRYTRMDVFEVEDGMDVRPNCAYIIPPNRDMAYADGMLRLLEPEKPRGRRLPIDFFFRSLAEDLHERAIGIVLSGAASDGTLGLRAIRGEGGLTIAQSPETADYDGMPRSAIDSGMVDEVLTPADMPGRLIAYAARAFAPSGRPGVPSTPGQDDALARILAAVRTESGRDFSGYKLSTITRRVQRRMAVNQVDRLDHYADYLARTPGEADALYRDLLIGVTSFFRDPDAFAALRDLVLQPLVARSPVDAVVRVWIPGCSTGEEAYSIAMMLQEEIEAQRRVLVVQMFATDIDDRAIGQARAGAYPSSIAADVSPERLARFFAEEASGTRYRVRRSLRDVVVFSAHDVISDPPFSKLDLISCRNVMIYMGAGLHEELLPKFHYALGPGGFLFLGVSEAVGRHQDLFAAVDRTAKVFERRGVNRGLPAPARLSVRPAAARSRSGQRAPVTADGDGSARLRELTERALLADSPRVAVLITASGQILYVHGRTGHYLEPAPGAADLNVMKMAREGLRRELTTAIHQAVAREEGVVRSALHVKTNGEIATVRLEVRPVDPGQIAGQPLFLVVLEEVPPEEPRGGASDAVAGAGDGSAGVDPRIALLERELAAKEEYLQSAVEELETSNEELRSSNEEMQSVNEELQSTNEELETSKEELQSVNEELATINAELQTTVADFTRTNNDMSNLLAGTGVATVFVDLRQHITRFTPGVTAVINLIPTDLGRPLGHVVSNLAGYNRLVEDVQSVLDDLVPVEIEVQNQAGAWYLMGIRPYRTIENVIEGAVITFTDTTEMKRAQAVVQEVEDLRRLAGVVQDSRDAIVVSDLDGRILGWNPAATRIFGWSEAQALAMNILDLVPEAQRQDAIDRVIELSRAVVLEPRGAQWIARDGRIVEVWLVATALLDEGGAPYAIATTLRGLVPEDGGGSGPPTTEGDG